MEKSKEIRLILSSRVAFRNGAYMAAPSLGKLNFVGLYDGSKAAMMFGVLSRRRQYYCPSMDAAVYSVENIFEKLGRPVYFQSDPEQLACLIRMIIGNPVILTMDEEDEGIVIGAYTARTLLAPLTARRAFRSFERHLPEGVCLEFVASDLPKEPRETWRQRRVRKKTAKWEKRAMKVNAKVQSVAGFDDETGTEDDSE